MNQPHGAVNGLPAGKAPTQRKQPGAGSSLFRPTNNQKKRVFNAPLKPPPRPPQHQNGNGQSNLNLVNTFFNASTQSAQPVATSQGPTAQQGPVKEYKLVTSKRELLDGLRYHLLQLDDKLSLDIRSEDDFPKPARLHRRNPDWKTPAKDGDAPQEADAEGEAMAKRREARQKEREANLAQIAPSANTKRRNMFSNKKSAQVYHKEYTEEDKRRIQMNYEEKLPWVLEDYDQKHILIGRHNQGSMGVYAGFIHEPSSDGAGSKFRLIPIEKAYRFDKPSNLQEGVDYEAIEKAFKRKKNLEPELLLRKAEERKSELEREQLERKSRGLFVADRTTAVNRSGEDGDLDFEEDWADDEEGELFGADEDGKEAEKKVKEDQLQATIGFYERDVNELEAADKKAEEEERLKDYWGGVMRSKLEKRERNYNLGSDSDDDSAESDDDDKKKDEDDKAKLKAEEEGGKSALSSGANTPSGRKEKHPVSDREGGMKKSVSSRSLKRPGSDLSDASGTDASVARKKKKKSHHSSSQGPTPGGSRPMSPDGTRRGAGSDTDGGARSDGGKLRKKHRGPTSPSSPNSPPGSRAGSPGPNSKRNMETGPLPTAEEIKARIPPAGMLSKTFIAMYKTPTDPERRAQWTALIRKLIKQKDGRVYLRDAAPPPPPPEEASKKAENANPAG